MLPLGAADEGGGACIAADLGLVVAEKVESQDSCFIAASELPSVSARAWRGDAPGDIDGSRGMCSAATRGWRTTRWGSARASAVGPEPLLRGVRSASKPANSVVVFADETLIGSGWWT